MKFIKKFKLFESKENKKESSDTERLKARIVSLVQDSDLGEEELYKIVEILSKGNYPIH